MKKSRVLDQRSNAEIINVHLNNLIATFGEQTVRAVIADSLVKKARKRAARQVAKEEAAGE